jgi:hypothetical protein
MSGRGIELRTFWNSRFLCENMGLLRETDSKTGYICNPNRVFQGVKDGQKEQLSFFALASTL